MEYSSRISEIVLRTTNLTTTYTTPYLISYNIFWEYLFVQLYTHTQATLSRLINTYESYIILSLSIARLEWMTKWHERSKFSRDWKHQM